jgi:hypothetical protein
MPETTETTTSCIMNRIIEVNKADIASKLAAYRKARREARRQLRRHKYAGMKLRGAQEMLAALQDAHQKVLSAPTTSATVTSTAPTE